MNGLSSFFETYTSKKISETASIKLELIDADFLSRDDLVFRNVEHVPAYLGYRKKQDQANFISIIGYWRPEYEK